uniref:Uncharacterized protein n=1 Tax=Sinocyclocheilus grahami TaxID=75366 RepID=A0A672S789_SINGR
MRQVQERRRGHEDDLKHPQAHVRDGERFVIADILTTRLLSIVGLLVTPHVLRRCSQHQDPEDEEDAHPYLADDEESPVVWCFGLLSKPETFEAKLLLIMFLKCFP